MMMPTTNKRRGVIVPMSAVLAVVLFGMVAFAVDLGWIAVVKSDLQNAADSAALAGANPLMENFVLYNLPNQSAAQKTALVNSAMAGARTRAKEFAAYNAAGGVSSLKLLDEDIEFGFLDASKKYTALPGYTGYPNTIKVTIRRDDTANGKLSLFFGGVFGLKSTDVSATASATLYSGKIEGFTPSARNSGLLPITYDVNDWNNFLKTGKGKDGLPLTDSSGNPILEVYSEFKQFGNFGQLSLNDTHVGASTEISWVRDGVPAGDIESLIANNLIPLSKHDSTKWDWLGDTGFKSSLVQAINEREGNTYGLPLFKAVSSDPLSYQPGVGTGSHYSYNIVDFVGIKIMRSPVDNRIIMIQPAGLMDPNALFDPATIGPAGTSTSQSMTMFTTPRLTQ